MKEFEKWWHKHRGGALENFELDKKHNSLAWKAALGWALASGNWKNIVYRIKKELNDE